MFLRIRAKVETGNTVRRDCPSLNRNVYFSCAGGAVSRQWQNDELAVATKRWQFQGRDGWQETTTLPPRSLGLVWSVVTTRCTFLFVIPHFF